MMHFYDTQTLPVSPWRNGSGETREIISFPPHATVFDWRASIATIARRGDFSLFPGVDRVITLLEGEGVELYAAGEIIQALRLNQPFAFAGETPIFSKLSGEKSLDFNVMTRRDSTTARVFTTSAAQQCQAGVFWIITGEWQVGEKRLTRGEGAWWYQGGEPVHPMTADALMLFAQIETIENAVPPSRGRVVNRAL
nr:HutD family protein [Pantoea sp. 201603H]